MRTLLLTAAVAAFVASFEPATAQTVNRDVLEEIVVTGERTNRSLRETASSVSAANAEEIERRAAFTSSDLLADIPNVTTSEPSNFAPAVRGLDGTGPATGGNAFIAGTRPRLGYQLDGRTLSYNEAIFSDASLWDVSQVEVYRGPQSTLQGRNAIAGIVAIRTNEPTFEWQGKARAIVGEYSRRQLSASISGPLVGNAVAFRLSGDSSKSESPVEIAFPGVRNPGEHRSEAARGRLLITPAALPDMRTLISLSHIDAYAPQSTVAARPFEDYQGRMSAPFPGNYARFQTRADTAVVDTSWGLTDSLSLEALASAADLKIMRTTFPGNGTANIDGTEYSVEPRLRVTLFDGRVKGFFGAFFFRNDQSEFLDLLGGLNFEDTTETNAVFGETTLALSPSLDLIIGARYEEEARDRVGGRAPFLVNFDVTYKEFLPKATLSWKANDDVTIGATAGRGYNGGGAGFTFFPPFVGFTFEPEHVWNYEVFTRASLFSDRVTISANAFYNDYSDLQLPFDLNPDPLVLANVIRNADKVETYGTELSTQVAPSDRIQLFLDVGYLETEVTRNPGSGIEGNELARSPSYYLSLGLRFRPLQSLELNFNGRYSDSFFSEVFNDTRNQVDSYFLANAQASYDFDKGRLFVSVENIFDELVPTFIIPGPTLASDLATLSAPRTVTAGVEFRF